MGVCLKKKGKDCLKSHATVGQQKIGGSVFLLDPFTIHITECG